jgi:hypothetical protein
MEDGAAKFSVRVKRVLKGELPFHVESGDDLRNTKQMTVKIRTMDKPKGLRNCSKRPIRVHHTAIFLAKRVKDISGDFMLQLTSDPLPLTLRNLDKVNAAVKGMVVCYAFIAVPGYIRSDMLLFQDSSKTACGCLLCGTKDCHVVIVKPISVGFRCLYWSQLSELYVSAFYVAFSNTVTLYEGVSKSFRTGRLERVLQMVQLFANRCSCIAILSQCSEFCRHNPLCCFSASVCCCCCCCLFRYQLSPETFVSVGNSSSDGNEPYFCRL